MTEWDADLALAHSPRRCRRRHHHRPIPGSADLVVEAKPDLTPVTDADRAVEQALRGQLERERPADAFLGEEYGVTGSGPRRWVVDPIDGTKNFVRGVPVWATLIALQHDEQTVVGVVSAPALGRRWWAARGAGAWTGPSASQGRACRVSKVGNLADASLSYSSLGGWDTLGRLPQFLELLARVWRSRAYGDFWSHVLVAEGAVDVSCEPDLAVGSRRASGDRHRGWRAVQRSVRRRARRWRQRGVQQRAAARRPPCGAGAGELARRQCRAPARARQRRRTHSHRPRRMAGCPSRSGA